MVLTEHEYIEGMFKALEQNLSVDEKLKVIDSYPTGQADMRSTVTELRQQKFDALGVFLTPGQIDNFINFLQSKKLARLLSVQIILKTSMMLN